MVDMEVHQILVRASSNRVGEFLKPCGSLVQVSCPESPVSGSSHSKANMGWVWGLNLKQKKVSLRFSTVYQRWL